MILHLVVWRLHRAACGFWHLCFGASELRDSVIMCIRNGCGILYALFDSAETNQLADDSDLYDERALADHNPPSQGNNYILDKHRMPRIASCGSAERLYIRLVHTENNTLPDLPSHNDLHKRQRTWPAPAPVPTRRCRSTSVSPAEVLH